MRTAKRSLIHVWASAFVYLLFASCSGNGATGNKTASTDTLNKPRWVDPRKGKIWGKVNIVQIPLTATENHIFGPLKSVTYKDYKISDGDSTKILEDSGFNAYDKFGHLVDQNAFKADGTAKWNCVYKYDNNNKAAEWNFKFENAKQDSKTTFKYDAIGNEIESSTYGPDGKLTEKGTKKYDARGNETDVTIYDADGKIKRMETYKYDSRDFQIEWKESDANGKLKWKLTQDYDSFGNKISGASTHSDSTIDGKWTNTNDRKGRTIGSISYDKNGKIHSTSKRKYDDFDNITEYIAYKPDGSVDTAGWNAYTVFEYDTRGNAIKETWYKLKSGKKVKTDVAERKFEYY